MASEKYKSKSYTKWVMGLPNPTGPVLQYKKYILAHRASSSSPEPPATPGADFSSPVPPERPLPPRRPPVLTRASFASWTASSARRTP